VLFRLEVLEYLLSITKPTRPRERPTLNEFESDDEASKRDMYRPPQALCHDDVGHTPSCDGKNFASKCKYCIRIAKAEPVYFV
jgi:hypothetical protein